MMLGIIPARAGSKGIKNKNIYPLNGKRLIDYTIDALEQSNLKNYVISTDIVELIGAPNVMYRPPRLARDETPTLPVIQYVIGKYEDFNEVKIDAVMILQPTSPLRTVEDINNSLDMFLEGDNDSLVSVCEGIHPMKSYNERGEPFFKQTPYDKHKHQCYTRNGAIFIASRKLIDSGRLFSDKPLLYVMSKANSIDIDDMEDMQIAEAILRARRG